MKRFAQTLCFHGYGGSPEGSVRFLMDELPGRLPPGVLGEIRRPGLPFGRDAGAGFGDDLPEMTRRLQEALALPWGDLRDTLLVGFSMGGFLGAMVAQRQAVGAVCALSAPAWLTPEVGLDPTRPLGNLLAVYSSRHDPVLGDRTLRWPELTPLAFDVDGVDHAHDDHREAFLARIVPFLEGL